ncbi:ADP-ribose pyrophosphatase YjhB, NUDIX family [Pseudobutyrivibrio sp. YE44]|uniref:NUDIX hydrolase n=1 Tax=Pseudobutyrivibrio sp. YE44 TaxID=1520802 RepID=UPI00088B23DB|nr:NUDIX domain-containing protein [Pseudobutyrivibrio sp. YE44]SDB24042.1 ADP-ribose pyrophosphatase YjhB, NUDIX family [Pseudobutyrivibrio sp. YE44]
MERKNKDGLTEKEFLAQYNPGDYKRPSVTTDILLLGMNEDYSSLKLLLIKRGNHPYIGCWALPGGFVEENESAYQAAARELQEETGLSGVYLDQIYTFTKPGRDPRTWVMSIAYLALVPSLDDVKGYDDADDAAWFDLKFTDNAIEISNEDKDVQILYDLKKEEFVNGAVKYENFIPTLVSEESLAFDHVEILIEAVKRLREQIYYNNQAFCLVDETFTLSELQRVYEAVLGKPLYKKSFRDMVSNKVEETGNEKTSRFKGGRRSTEYRFKA